MKTEVLSFRSNIPANTNQLFKERIKDNGRISEIRVRFYGGQERDLQIRPYALLTGQRAEDILTYVSGTDAFLSGDDDYFVYPVSLELNMDDEFCVSANNVNATYSYTMSVDVIVNYYGEEGGRA